MSHEPKLTIAGNNDLASEMARNAISSGLADPAYLWRDIQDPLVSHAPVVIVADGVERAGFARLALDAGLSVVSLPFPDADDALVRAIERGKLRLISPLHGSGAMAQIHADCVAGKPGRRYGVYAAHRLPRNFSGEVPSALNDLLVYVTSLIDSPATVLSATQTTIPDNGFEGWFVLARFADDTIATVEVSGVLPDSESPTGDVLVEVTGTEAVLRGEPERQSINVFGRNGFERQAWYGEPSARLLRHAMSELESSRTRQHVSAQRLIQNVDGAAGMDEVLRLPT